jgi:glutaredoxin
MRIVLRIVPVAGIVLALLCGSASAQMYRWVDKDGRVHYTQTPPPPDAKSAQKKSIGPGGSAAPYGELPYASQTAAKNFPVTLYTAPECGAACDQARALLVRRAVPFREVDVRAQKDIDNLKAVSGGAQVPFLVVGSQKQGPFTEEAYGALLDAAGYPTSGPRLPLEALRKTDAPAKAPEPAEGGESSEEAAK